MAISEAYYWRRSSIKTATTYVIVLTEWCVNREELSQDRLGLSIAQSLSRGKDISVASAGAKTLNPKISRIKVPVRSLEATAGSRARITCDTQSVPRVEFYILLLHLY